MRIGVDLDNTIIQYDGLFYGVARDRGLVPAELFPRKQAVRAWLQLHHGNDAWTSLQGEVYGRLMGRAEPFPHVAEFFERCLSNGVPVCILSHKTRFAASGDPFDLQEAARLWLTAHGYFGLASGDVEFHETRLGKVEAIARRRCDVFIDDLPEVFSEIAFPQETSAILFDPEGQHPALAGVKTARSWTEIANALFTAKPTR